MDPRQSSFVALPVFKDIDPNPRSATLQIKCGCLRAGEGLLRRAESLTGLSLFSGARTGIKLLPMSKPRRKQTVPDPLGIKPRKPVPYEFVLDAISALAPLTRPMFGCLAVYVEEKIVLILRDKAGNPDDNGVWLATAHEHHESLRREFPNMRSIKVLGKKVTGWQLLPADSPDFEQAAYHACELVLARDARIGKIPGTRKPRSRVNELQVTNGAKPRKSRSKRRSS